MAGFISMSNNFPSAKDRLAALPKHVVEGEKAGVVKGASLVESTVKLHLRRGGPTTLWRRTGNLAKSLNASKKAIKKAGRWIALVGFRKGAVDKYAETQEYGRTITAKTSRGLRFPIRKGGGKSKGNIIGWRTVQSVTIPARKPLRRSLAKHKRDIARLIKIEINKALERG